MRAFEQNLIFTIGKSVTTGRDNSIIWGDIPHKTNLTSNSGGYGYPDNGYLQRVTSVLAVQGINVQDDTSKPLSPTFDKVHMGPYIYIYNYSPCRASFY